MADLRAAGLPEGLAGEALGRLDVAGEVGEHALPARREVLEQRLAQLAASALELGVVAARLVGRADLADVEQAPVHRLRAQRAVLARQRDDLVAERHALVEVLDVQQRHVAAHERHRQRLGVAEAPRHRERLGAQLHPVALLGGEVQVLGHAPHEPCAQRLSRRGQPADGLGDQPAWRLVAALASQ